MIHPMEQMRTHMVLVEAHPRVNRRYRLHSEPVAATTRPGRIADLAVAAEEAKLDAVFFIDFIGLDRFNAQREPISPFEPMTALATMAAHTDRVGLIGTMSTMFNFPYNVARQFASLEHFSSGRSGWNLVTSFKNEALFGFDELPSPKDRYDAAQEFLDICLQLWDSWDPDAVVADPERGIWADIDKIRDVHYEGTHYQLHGGLDAPRSPQGRPVVMQAGASDEGVAFAGRNAEVIFAGHPVLEMAAEYYSRVKSVAVDAERSPSEMAVLTGVHIYLGETEDHAWQRARAAAIPERDRVEAILGDLRGQLPGFNLDGLDWDEPMPADRFPTAGEIEKLPGRRSRTQVYRRLALEHSPTVRHFLDFTSIAGAHTAFIGTVQQVADEMERWFAGGGCDGFAFIGGDTVRTLNVKLLPELRRRGLFRTEYEGSTLREHLGFA